MKRYLFCALLVGNVALGMEGPPEEEKTLNVIDELDKIEKALPGAESPEHSSLPTEIDLDPPIEQMTQEQIERLLKQRSGTFYPPNSPFLQAIDKRCQALKMGPYNQPTAQAEAPVVGGEKLEQKHPAQSTRVVDRLFLDSDIQKMSKMQLDTLFAGRAQIPTAAVERYSELQAKELPSAVPEASTPQGAIPSKYQDKLDLIESMTRKELTDYQLGFNDPELPRSPSETEILGKAIADRSSELDDLSRNYPGSAGARLKSALKLNDPERALSPKKEAHVRFDASNSDGSGIKRPVQPAAAEIPAPFTPENFTDASDGSDFEARIQEALPQDRKTSGSPRLPVEQESSLSGTDAPLIPVKKDADPLFKAPAPTPMPTGQTETLENRAASQDDSHRTALLKYASVAPKPDQSARTPDTRGDAALAVKLTEEGGTPGGPDSPQLPVKKEGSGSDKDQWSLLQKTLIAAGVVGALYTGTEVVIAYKSIPEKKWKEASGFMNKTKLVLGKTWENVTNRPAQGVELLKRLAGKARAA